MIRDEVIIGEINALWLPVYGHMAEYALAAAGLDESAAGRFLDLGPFAGGLAAAVLRARELFVATVIDESERVLRWAEERAVADGCAARLITRRAPLEPIPEPDAGFDLVAVRGAFFFLTPGLLAEIRRVLRPGGFAWVGGGYGPTTPAEVIAPLADRSKVLNEAIGKQRITPAAAQALVEAAGLEDCARVVTEGGLWIEVRAHDAGGRPRRGL